MREGEDILEYSRLEYVIVTHKSPRVFKADTIRDIHVSNMVEYAPLKIVRGFLLKYTLHLSCSFIRNDGEPLLNEFYERK